ncbi:hypothetical protein K1X76_08605 [bacterium]|nr:hypothetical protein [bacterium]
MNIIQAPRKDKKQHFERLMEKGTVMVFLDSRKTGVKVPDAHLANPQLCLKFNYAFEIPDFKITDDKIEASLSFGGRRFFCELPFDALFAVTLENGGEVVFFPEDLPGEFTLYAAGSAIKAKAPEALTAIENDKNAPRPAFTVVKGEGELAGSNETPTPRKKPSLKLVE